MQVKQLEICKKALVQSILVLKFYVFTLLQSLKMQNSTKRWNHVKTDKFITKKINLLINVSVILVKVPTYFLSNLCNLKPFSINPYLASCNVVISQYQKLDL